MTSLLCAAGTNIADFTGHFLSMMLWTYNMCIPFSNESLRTQKNTRPFTCNRCWISTMSITLSTPWLSVHYRNLLHTQKREAFWTSLCISWCISSFHSRPTTPSFAHARTQTIIHPPLPPPPLPPPPYLQDLSSLFLPCWLTSPRPKECLTLGSGWIRAVPAPTHAQLFLMSSSRSGLWAS